MATGIKQSLQKQPKRQFAKAQVLESLRDLAGGATDSFIKNVASETSKDFLGQMFNLPERRLTGDLVPGETLEIKEALTGQSEENKKLRGQLVQEQRMYQEEKQIVAKKQQELRMQLSVLTSEVSQLTKTTQGLSHETQIATMQAVVDPGTYHLIFFEKLLEFIQSFRKKIEDASVWLSAYNTRSKRRAHTFWGQVGVSGSKRLLSAEDYSQRAAA